MILKKYIRLMKTSPFIKSRYIRLLATVLIFGQPLSGRAQRMLNLDSCRSLAMDYNKQLAVSRTNRDMAEATRKAARTLYLPKADAMGTYQLTSRETSLLSRRQQDALNHLGDNTSQVLQGDLAKTLPGLVRQGAITEDQAQSLAAIASRLAPATTETANEAGQSLRKALRTNTRNLFVAGVAVRQPLYMGGAIKASNRMADIGINMADNNIDLETQNTLYDVEQAYWLVVSLKQKQRLSSQYLDLVRKLHDDVAKMLSQGVATRADELRVAVRVNEAELSQTQVDDGLVLARMHLCQICGLDLGSDIKLADEDCNDTDAGGTDFMQDAGYGYDRRPELKLLKNAVDLSRQNTILTRAAFLPQILATGGYLFSNPNVLNGYRNTFAGLFHVGVTLHVPLWNWGEGRHRVRAAKAATHMAQLELADTEEKIQLQVSQAEFRTREAYKKLAMANHNLASANENLRCANLGFKEGMMQTTDVMEAQTAWQSAQSQKNDAEIDVRMAHANLRKATGTLTIN